MATILDSGARRQFYDKDGNPLGVRDIADDKGSEYLLPMDIVSSMISYRDSSVLIDVLTESMMFDLINEFIKSKGDTEILYRLLHLFINREYRKYDDINGLYIGDYEKAIMEVAIHYRDGMQKYGPRSWERGIPCHCFIDSALRHGMKYFRGDTDEPHNRAFIWNIMGLLWTMKHKPELNDLFEEDNKEVVNTTPSSVPVDLSNNEKSKASIEDIKKNGLLVFKINKDIIKIGNKIDLDNFANKDITDDYTIYCKNKLKEFNPIEIPKEYIGITNYKDYIEIHILPSFDFDKKEEFIKMVSEEERLELLISAITSDMAVSFPISEHNYISSFPDEHLIELLKNEINGTVNLNDLSSLDNVEIIDANKEDDNDTLDGGEEESSESNDISSSTNQYLELTFLKDDMAKRIIAVNPNNNKYSSDIIITINWGEFIPVDLYYRSEVKLSTVDNSIKIPINRIPQSVLDNPEKYIPGAYIITPFDATFKKSAIVTETEEI